MKEVGILFFMVLLIGLLVFAIAEGTTDANAGLPENGKFQISCVYNADKHVAECYKIDTSNGAFTKVR